MSATAVRARDAALLSVLLLGGCMLQVGETVPRNPPPAPVPAPDVLAAAVEEGVHEQANRTRVREGIGSLTRDSVLDAVARAYSDELTQRRVLSHESPTPGRETMTARVNAAGVKWTLVAENLASTSSTRSSVPVQVIEMWLGSPGHRRNLLDARFIRTGIGAAVDRYGVWYVTQLYVRP
jgi:uncharacterized protein YkwD